MAHTLSSARATGRARATGLSFTHVFARLSAWRELTRQRQALSRLSPEHLRDIGLDGDAALAEADRPFWDAPRGWR